MKKLIKEYNIPEKDVLQFLVEHIVDMLVFEDKIKLLNYLYGPKLNYNSFENLVKKYLDTKLIKGRNLIGIILFSKGKMQIMILHEKKWKVAEPEDERDILQENESNNLKIENLNKLVGFIGYEQKHIYLVFKVKDMAAARNTGARCDESAKNKKLQLLNEIIGENKFNKENTKGMVQAELCSLQEFLLRYYNKERKNGKIWFLDFETAMINKF